ncbi:unnamed protein product [Litomosoides sigmodontis]|uniref:Uncharacterized protein n=1 Tax=Litomosoides sigmodontis TaxID=42156 RepID=A0A3P6V087_LITSI|nr:unnamed protein product [Litomosoides sigmodontis]
MGGGGGAGGGSGGAGQTVTANPFGSWRSALSTGLGLLTGSLIGRSYPFSYYGGGHSWYSPFYHHYGGSPYYYYYYYSG